MFWYWKSINKALTKINRVILIEIWANSWWFWIAWSNFLIRKLSLFALFLFPLGYGLKEWLLLLFLYFSLRLLWLFLFHSLNVLNNFCIYFRLLIWFIALILIFSNLNLFIFVMYHKTRQKINIGKFWWTLRKILLWISFADNGQFV